MRDAQFYFTPRGEFIGAVITVVQADGRTTISYAKGASRDTVHWYYEAHGSAEVHQTTRATSDGHRSVSQTYWSVSPDGGPLGDVYESLAVLLDDGWTRQIDTARQPDGTVTTRIRVISAPTARW